ncbi:MAG TPA: isoprenylcysteine carboxylmethyltransferase family protein [Longimicrobiaceae bacterium]|nr:isoprenylcysteine carboxylmethyltransferase family protein [Longimicrobiaceae bacterium]
MTTPPEPLKNPGIRFPPPLVFVGGLGFAALLHNRWPLPIWPSGRTAILLILAYALIGGGLAWMYWGLITFRRAKTTVLPHQAASTIVTHGPYRFGRNPMYLGMCALYFGVTLWLNSIWGLLIFPIVIFLIISYVISREEAYLIDDFGDEYERYRSSVPRWLGSGRTRS